MPQPRGPWAAERKGVNRRHHHSIAAVHVAVLDYIERFHKPRMQQPLDIRNQKFVALIQLSVEKG